MSSFTQSHSTTFTITHAKHMAAKVAADLKRMQRFYGQPSDERINEFEEEVVELLKAGYLGTVTYGYQRSDQWITPTLRYTANELSSSATNDDPGRVPPGADTSGAVFRNYLTYSDKWWALTGAERAAFKQTLPFQRTEADEPGTNGYFTQDLTYSAGGRSMSRSSVRSY